MTKDDDVPTLQQIMEREYPRPPEIIKRLLSPEEIALFVARQKEGKSTLTFQLAIDISCGDKFLDRYETSRQNVLYIDYENRFGRIKDRALDLARGRQVDRLFVKAFDIMSERDVGLTGEEYVNLHGYVRQTNPELVIIDPFRYAFGKTHGKSLSEESQAVIAIDQLSNLRTLNPNLASIIVHHVKKRQDFTKASLKLKDDPRSWIEQSYGSQALLAHVDTIWGLEQDGDGHVFATVPRAAEPITIHLEKQPDSERFLLNTVDSFSFKTVQQREAWSRLPNDFGWRELKPLGFSNNMVNQLLRQGKAAGLLIQDAKKRYHKVTNQ